MMRSVKLVLVGDEAVGKTCLGLSYTNGYIISEHVPTVFDHYAASVQIDDMPINLGVWDSAGGDAYDSFRPLSYPNTQVFLVCFSLANRESYEHVISKWYPEINHYCPGVPFILVGTKLDLRECINTDTDDSERRSVVIQYEQGLVLSKKIGAVRYMECSATTLRGVENVFEEAVKATFITLHVRERRRFCNIL